MKYVGEPMDPPLIYGTCMVMFRRLRSTDASLVSVTSQRVMRLQSRPLRFSYGAEDS